MVSGGLHRQQVRIQEASQQLGPDDLEDVISPTFFSDTSLTFLEHRIQPADEIWPNQPVKIGPTIDTRHLRQYRLDPTIHRSHPQDLPAAVRTAPNPDLVLVHVRSRLRVRNGVRVITGLLCRNDFMARCAFFGFAVAEAAVVVDQAGDGSLEVKYSANVFRSSLSGRRSRGP
jgi:hypothetical protein